MKDRKKRMAVFRILGITGMLWIVILVMAYFPGDIGEHTETEENTKDLFEKGYDLPVDEEVRGEAESECLEVMTGVEDIYAWEMREDHSLGKEVLREAAEKISRTGNPVTAGENGTMSMWNHDMMDEFLRKISDGREHSIVLYRLFTRGEICREEYSFDGKNMYLLSCIGSWEDSGTPVILSTTYTRIQNWEYTEKGWFCYELCVPEPPEVSEVVDGNVLIRVEPLPERYLETAEKYLRPLGYMGNNLLRSDWEEGQMENMDFTGCFEYLYQIRRGEEMDPSDYAGGIPQDEFESLMTEYLPVTADELRKSAGFDEKKQIYPWISLGCGTYSVNAFSTSFPEITDMTENDDGTLTLQVDAVCEMAGTDRALSHEITIELRRNGDVRYLKNKVAGDGIRKIPEYEYRRRR